MWMRVDGGEINVDNVDAGKITVDEVERLMWIVKEAGKKLCG